MDNSKLIQELGYASNGLRGGCVGIDEVIHARTCIEMAIKAIQEQDKLIADYQNLISN